MKKNILLNSILLFCITILSTGCTITANTDITFDDKDNMKVETTVLFPRELMTYSEDMAQEDLTKDYITEIDGAKVLTDVKKIDNNSGIGNRKVEICKNISRAKKVKTISFIIAQDSKNGILTVKNYLLFKKYIFRGQLTTPEKVKSYDNSVNPNGLISSQVRIQIPSQAKGVKANTNTTDVDNLNIYVWKIDYTGVNPIDIEFFMINWYIVSVTIVILLALLFYLIYSGKKKFVLSAMNAKAKNTEYIQEKTTQKTPQVKQKPKKTKLVLLILLAIFVLAGTGIYFSLPTVCSTLVDNGIKSVYVGEIENAEKMIEVANVLNYNQSVDIAGSIFEKGIAEIENNDDVTAKIFFDLLAKTNTQNKKDYARELSDRAMKALKINKLNQCKYLTEAANRFDSEIAKKNLKEYDKKVSSLIETKKFQEALVVNEISISLNSGNPEAWYNKGRILFNLNKNKEAIDSLTKAINLKNDYSDAYFQRSVIYYSKFSNYEKSLYDMTQGIRYCFDKEKIAHARLSVAKIYIKKQDYRKAMDEAWTAKELFNSIGNSKMTGESFRIFDYAAELECDRPYGYCYY